MEESCKRDHEFGELCPGHSAEQKAGCRAKVTSRVRSLVSGLACCALLGLARVSGPVSAVVCFTFPAGPCGQALSLGCSQDTISCAVTLVVESCLFTAGINGPASRKPLLLFPAPNGHLRTGTIIRSSMTDSQAKSRFGWNATSHPTASSIIFPG
jgi:hypothetical protein